jgi:hypothetical protein
MKQKDALGKSSMAGDVFILQVTGVFTRIRSGATLAADCGGAYRSDLLCGGSGAEGHKCRCVWQRQLLGVKTLRGSTFIYNPSRNARLTNRLSP